MRVCIVIPARLDSTRLPRKLLLRETGKSLLQHTYEASRDSKLAEDLFVATDSDQIIEEVNSFGAATFLTGQHNSGTDRVAEFAHKHAEFDVLVNVQGDEPEVDPNAIDEVIKLFADPTIQMATLACPISSVDSLNDPACVKVVLNQKNEALYFSRSPIPFTRDTSSLLSDHHFQHIGLYAYRRDFLLEISRMPAGNLEIIEQLEQLRVLESGHKIKVALVESSPPGIDTAEDYAAFVRRSKSC